ncbi:30S ribosomal protein S16 [Candidatus Uhrbacteria bacterium]|nr:30S ribosomal protein S16 [Candidatus Uhrbacteria bacterium]
MLSIRLTRIGKRKQPTYRLIVTEKGRDPWGRSLEILGQVNPRSTPPTVNLKEDRVRHWISKGAQPTDTVWNLLNDLKIVEGPKRRSVTITKRRAEKLAKKASA